MSKAKTKPKIRVCVTLDKEVIDRIQEGGYKLSTVTNIMLLAFLDPQVEITKKREERPHE